MPLSFSSVLGFDSRALGVESQRMQILASNLANSDTPNYKAKDINFAAAMQAAASDMQQSGLSRTQPDHFAGLPPAPPANVIEYRIPTQPSIDGNTVDQQVEEAAFSRNAMNYQATLTFLGNSIKNLMTAVKGS